MAASAVRITQASFAQPVDNGKIHFSQTSRKPMKKDFLYSALRPRPGVLAMREDRVLIKMQWKAGKRIRQIAKKYEVPRDAVEDLLREVA